MWKLDLKNTYFSQETSTSSFAFGLVGTSVTNIHKIFKSANDNCQQQLSFPPNATNIIFIRKPFLFRQNCFKQKLTNQTQIEGTILRTEQWSGAHSTACRGFNTDRCLNKGLRGNVQ